ncbi:MAG: hypothetical protein ACFFCQ_02220 [Promethearchaeota archaeon]
MAGSGEPPQPTEGSPDLVQARAKVGRRGQITLPRTIREAGKIVRRSDAYLRLDETTSQSFLIVTSLPKKNSKSIKIKITKNYRFTIPKKWQEKLDLPGVPVILTCHPDLTISIEKATYQILTRAERLWLSPEPSLAQLCYLAKNLYNQALYLSRQEYFKTKTWVRYNELNTALKTSPNYKGLPSQTAQQILRLVDAAWASYFTSLKDWQLHPEKYCGKPHLPKYKPKTGQFILPFTNQQTRLKNGPVYLPRVTGLVIKTRLVSNASLRGARLIPK